MKAWITGADGQVGRALRCSTPAGWDVCATAHAEVDICAHAQVRRAAAEHAPDIIINAAAYTAVDRAESQREQAFLVNEAGPRVLAEVARERGIRLLHISTDFVFDGQGCVPYPVDAPAAPLNVYGSSKLQGEREVLQQLPGAGVVLRTAWVYSAVGHNFVRTMLRLLKEQGRVNVVADQFGTPTSAASLAKALWAIAARSEVSGLQHWTDEGVASWYDFAVAIAEEGEACGLLAPGCEVMAIASRDYPTAARRPCFTVLDKTTTIAALGYRPQHWRRELRGVLRELHGG
jgi:dTDP-4-dehydrorhamnose reductase